MINRTARTVATVAVAVAGTFAGAVAASSPASATPPPAPAILDCEGGLVLVNTNKGNAFRVADSTQNFVIMSGTLLNDDGTTTVIQAPNGTQMSRDLQTCTFTGPVSGRVFQVSGFFTPAT